MLYIIIQVELQCEEKKVAIELLHEALDITQQEQCSQQTAQLLVSLARAHAKGGTGEDNGGGRFAYIIMCVPESRNGGLVYHMDELYMLCALITPVFLTKSNFSVFGRKPWTIYSPWFDAISLRSHNSPVLLCCSGGFTGESQCPLPVARLTSPGHQLQGGALPPPHREQG